jgi:magnesium chelatase family protein
VLAFFFALGNFMMKVQSLIQDRNALVPVEVELTLWPGLPGIQFLGLPDQHLKESAMRIKSAIKAAGFQFPVAQQILVNLRPSHLKKTSRGLELAVAAAYLWESGQIPAPILGRDLFLYGELTLSGEVLEPEDLAQSFQEPGRVLMTGQIQSNKPARFRRQIVPSLRELMTPTELAASNVQDTPIRPQEAFARSYSKEQARLIAVLAVGEHSALMAGAAGSGKSTMAQMLPGFLRAPSEKQFYELKKIHSEFGEELTWRPVVKPHHSTPTMAMIGGGSVPFAGEISRAHGGVLILDELLEFSSQVQESLREPFEEGKMRVFRNGRLKEYPARAQILATTNLCPCGKWTPLDQDKINCGLGRVRCRSYGRRLSGPLLDRFEILYFTRCIGELVVSGKTLFKKIKKAQAFCQSFPNSRKPAVDILKTLSPGLLQTFEFEQETSQRRKMAALRVARTLADLDLSEQINLEHIREAKELCVRPFSDLAHWN